MDNPERYW